MALPKGLSSILVKSPSDIVILSSLRTPICRSYRGQLKDAYPEELLSVVLRATLDANPNLPPEQIYDVAVGVVLSELGGSKAARMAMNHVGFPSTTSLVSISHSLLPRRSHHPPKRPPTRSPRYPTVAPSRGRRRSPLCTYT